MMASISAASLLSPSGPSRILCARNSRVEVGAKDASQRKEFSVGNKPTCQAGTQRVVSSCSQMLHRKRLHDPEARTPEVKAFLAELNQSNEFYSTPPRSNDDW